MLSTLFILIPLAKASKSIELGKPFSGTVSRDEPQTFTYDFNGADPKIGEDSTLRLFASAIKAEPEFPVQVKRLTTYQFMGFLRDL